MKQSGEEHKVPCSKWTESIESYGWKYWLQFPKWMERLSYFKRLSCILPKVTIVPSVNRYYYITDVDLISQDSITIPANLFKNDSGDYTNLFKGLGPNSFNNLFVNGILQMSETFNLSPNTLILNTKGTTIYCGTPITVEIVEFSSFISYK